MIEIKKAKHPVLPQLLQLPVAASVQELGNIKKKKFNFAAYANPSFAVSLSKPLLRHHLRNKFLPLQCQDTDGK